MADEADLSDVRQAKILEAAINAARRTEAGFIDTGFCWFCDEPLISGKFCDEDCRSDYEKQ